MLCTRLPAVPRASLPAGPRALLTAARPVRGQAACAIFLLLHICALAMPAAQSARAATYRVFERGTPIGTVHTAVARTPAGWSVTGRSALGGTINLEVRRLEIAYDARWRGRSISMELARPDTGTLVAHAVLAAPGTRTRTDVVLETEARPIFNHVSPNSVFLPDYVFGAYEALAARLALAAPGMQLPVFVVLRSEFPAVVESVAAEELPLASGTVRTRRWRLTIDRGLPCTVDLWEDGGRLVRVDLPDEHIAVVRADVLYAP